jgi:hypothetical protein
MISSWKAQMQESQFVFENIADVLNRLFDSKIGGRGRRRCLRARSTRDERRNRTFLPKTRLSFSSDYVLLCVNSSTLLPSFHSSPPSIPPLVIPLLLLLLLLLPDGSPTNSSSGAPVVVPACAGPALP